MRLPSVFRLPHLGPDWKESKALIVLAAPITGAALVNMGMSITDTVMMGWIGSKALAAGAVVSDLYSIVFYFLTGLLSIISPMIARAMGANDAAAVRRSMQSGILAALVLSAPALFTVWHATSFLHLLGVEGTVSSLGQAYAHTMAITIVPMLFVALWRNLFGAIGRPRVYLIAILAALPLNALADYVLMFGWGPAPALGIAGAGIASAIVAFGLLTGFVIFTLVNAELRNLRLFNGPWQVCSDELREIFRLGTPIAFFTIGEVGIFLLATVIVSLFGTQALAAHAITLRVAGVIYAIPTGLSQAATIRVSHAIGRADQLGLNLAKQAAVGVGAASGAMLFGLLAGGSDFLPRLFLQNEGDAICGLVSSLLVLLGVLNFAQGFAAPATAILRGFKDTRTPMFLCLAGYWLVGMPVSAIAGFQLGQGAFGIWIGLASGVVATALLMNMRLIQRNHADVM